MVVLGRGDCSLTCGCGLSVRAMSFPKLGGTSRFRDLSNSPPPQVAGETYCSNFLIAECLLSHFCKRDGPRRWCRQIKSEFWGDPRTVGIGFEFGQSPEDCKLEVLIISWGAPRISMTGTVVVIEAANRRYDTYSCVFKTSKWQCFLGL